MSYNVEGEELEEIPEEEPEPPKRGKKRKREKKSKRKKSKRAKHEDLGPRPEAKVDLDKLEDDITKLREEAASTGNKFK